MDKREFLDHVITSVRSLNLITVMSSRMELSRKSGHYKGLCPFHNDKTLGSFVATESKNIWKCFSCGVGGDAIKFVALMDKINYVEAAFRLALTYGLITDYEYRKYYERSRYSEEQISRIERRFEEIDRERLKNEVADEDTRDEVYTLFLQAIGEFYKENNKGNYDGLLKKRHKAHLVEKRDLSEQEIVDAGFFSFPSRWVMKRFVKLLQDKYGSDEILATIPGFFKEVGKSFFTFVPHKGIGIPIKNANGKIVAIQVRHDTKGGAKESRYVWFSSSFASFDAKYECGTSSGSPVDTVYPPVLKASAVFVTEGRFKALRLAKETGCVVLSVQGVSTWKGVLAELKAIPESPILKELAGGRKYEIRSIRVAFDADMNFNYAVFSQARKMADSLQQNGYFVYYQNWDDELGKGIDDIIINGHMAEIKRYDKEKWDVYYDNMIKAMLDEIQSGTCDSTVQELIDSDKTQPGNEGKTYDKIQDIPVEVVKIYFRRMMTLAPIAKEDKSQKQKEHEEATKRATG